MVIVGVMMDIKEKFIDDQKLAVINYKGPLSDLDLLLAKLMGWIESEDIKTEGSPFIIYYSPRASANVGDAVYDVGIPITEDVDGNDLIKIVDLFEHKVLSGIHKGSLDNILDSYEKMVDFSQKNSYDIIGSPKEVLIKNKFNIEEGEDYLTEIQLPVIKM